MPSLDLVLEGGGVKGLATAGAVSRLLDAGYRFERVAGTSVGAIAAAFAAAGLDAPGFTAVMERLDLSRIPQRHAPPLPLLGETVGLLGHRGAFRGDYLHDFLLRELAGLGVRTFADLRRDDPGADAGLTAEQRYKLVVMATDVTRGLLLRLPWDYPQFHLDPDEQLVADAVRCSLSIPFYFEPCALTDPQTGHTSVIVDGGVLSNFAVEIFDRTDGVPPRWPTAGVRLFPDLPAGLGAVVPLPMLRHTPLLELLAQVVSTALVGRDQTHLNQPGVRERTIAIDTSGVGITDFGIDAARRRALAQRGYDAAALWLVPA
ncbi:patatin-like phospholipase family protein [Actinoplanes sp. N902-109]|uniref:patatin-like phospholipase family protein n=1 Tax=Actinoplanes sp. (strain N902-109) TaxID=649831 RepID=UPI0003295F93|nr:patatin-like phospholipase family protein [Actinoplanes sp. N902-109]AGL19307.1 Patatin [Actinoplanes sp. N902-109]